MITKPSPSPWLERYGNLEGYRWRRSDAHDGDAFIRPLGLVEFSFDTDGRHFQGRADMNSMLEMNIKTSLTGNDFRERILIAWTLLRCQHLLLRARTVRDTMDSIAPQGLHFAVDVYLSMGKAIEAAGRELVFLEDYYEEVDEKDFFMHCQNVGRVIEAERALTKAFVLPRKDDGVVRMVFVIAHSICDGLTSCVWMRDLIKALNETEHTLREQIAHYIKPGVMLQHLPLPQEALYPTPPGTLAKQRWFWAITRVLRHVRKPLPAGFDNPLRRSQPLSKAYNLSPVYKDVLDYAVNPVLNSYPVWIRVSPSSTHRLRILCQSVHASLGAGIYALAALVTMELHEERHPQVPLHLRKHFITGFPLDPRAFLGFHTDPDSMMLAFSDGISLPFLPSSLDLEGRIKLLARRAQHQLASYQKRAKPKGEDATKQFLTSRGAGLVLANQYLYSLDRADACIPGQRSLGIDTQGKYPAGKNPTNQTHGVSSMGNREGLIRSGVYDLTAPGKDFTADFQELCSCVRPREGEFLLGIAGGKYGGEMQLSSTPSVDSTTLDPAMVDRWRDRFETILDQVDKKAML